jgi:hypothetical protein
MPAASTVLGLWLSILADWMGVLLIAAIAVLAAVQERRWVVHYLADEVAAGLIAPQQYRVACSLGERWREQARALRRGDFARYRRLSRLYQAMTHLAFRRYQLAVLAPRPGAAAEIDRFRQQIVALQGEL